MRKLFTEEDNKEEVKSRNQAPMNEKERLFDLLIHDMTGPLSIVTTSTANLLDKTNRYGTLTDQQRRITERILRNARKAQTLLQEMIEIFRSEEGLFRKEPFSIEKTLKDSLIDALEVSDPHLVEEVCRIEDIQKLKSFLENNGILIEITGKYCNYFFCHDQKKIEQIIRNLISNALKFRREQIKVSIGGDMDLSISVEDDGRGISEKDQQVIFERFTQLDNRGDSSIKGLGLGLTGVKTLVEAMGGKITLESREGFGTNFRVSIPPISPLFPPSKERSIVRDSILNGKKILAVDDEPDLLTILEEEILESSPNCQLKKATTYEKALEMMCSQDFDVVILDIMGVRGFDLLKLAVSRNFPVTMLTAHALSPEALKQSIEMGARAYLPKEKAGEIVPFLEDVFLHEYLIGWKRLLNQLDDFFKARWGKYWQKPEEKFWKGFEDRIAHLKNEGS